MKRHATARAARLQADALLATTRVLQGSALGILAAGFAVTGSPPSARAAGHRGLGQLAMMTAPGTAVGATIPTAYAYSSPERFAEPASVTTGSLSGVYVTASFAYDGSGNVVAAVDGLGNTTTRAYNLANQVVQETYPATGQTGCASASTVMTYLFPGGLPLTETLYDEAVPANAFRTVAYHYGKEGELLSASGNVDLATYTYDANYQPLTVTNGDSAVTTYTYEQHTGRLLSLAYPLGDGESYTYAADGQLLTRTNGRGVTTNFTYDLPTGLLSAVNRLADAHTDLQFTYDGYGRQTMRLLGPAPPASGWRAKVETAYDILDEPTQTKTTYTDAGLGVPVVGTLNYGYAPNGARASMAISPAIPVPMGATGDGSTYSYSYDAIGRPSGLSNPLGERTAWVYLNNGWLSQQKQTTANLPPTAQFTYTTTFQYNGRGFLTQQWDRLAGGTPLIDFGGDGTLSNDLLRDAGGNLLRLTGANPAPHAFAGTNVFTYDTHDRLLTEDLGRRVSHQTLSNCYEQAGPYYCDPTGGLTSGNGNLVYLEKTNTLSGGSNYNADDQPADPNMGPPPVYHFDADGNQNYYGAVTPTFDPEDRLTFLAAQPTLSGYQAAYLPEGLRGRKDNAAGTNATYFVYDGDEPVLELDATGAARAVSTWGVDGLVSRTPGSTLDPAATSFYQYDPSGNTAARLSSANAVRSVDSYTAFGAGQWRDATGAVINEPDPIGYAGQWGGYTDGETFGSVLMGHRYYAPSEGRFLTRDPIGYDGGMNQYAYAGDNPVNRVDPEGLLSGGPAPSGGAGAAAAIEAAPKPVWLGPLGIVVTAGTCGVIAGHILGNELADYYFPVGADLNTDDRDTADVVFRIVGPREAVKIRKAHRFVPSKKWAPRPLTYVFGPEGLPKFLGNYHAMPPLGQPKYLVGMPVRYDWRLHYPFGAVTTRDGPPGWGAAIVDVNVLNAKRSGDPFIRRLP